MEFFPHCLPPPFFFKKKEFPNTEEPKESISLKLFFFLKLFLMVQLKPLSQSFNQPGNLKSESTCFQGPMKVNSVGSYHFSLFWPMPLLSLFLCQSSGQGFLYTIHLLVTSVDVGTTSESKVCFFMIWLKYCDGFQSCHNILNNLQKCVFFK